MTHPALKTMWAQDAPLVRVRNSYDASTTGRRMGTKGSSRLGPNILSEQSRDMLAARAHHMRRNNAWVASGVETYIANMVGTGIVPRWKLKDDKLKAQIHTLYDQWTKECDADGNDSFYGLQALVAGTTYLAGEVLNRRRPRRTTDGFAVPLQLQLLETDHLATNFNQELASGGRILMSVEFDAIGSRAAFWLYRQHPGERNANVERYRIPASEIQHIFRRLRPGQIRGVTDLAAILVRLYELDEYEDAELVRKKAAAMFAAFVTKPLQQDDPRLADQDDDADNDGSYDSDSIEGIEPGAVHYLDLGEEVHFSQPADVGQNYKVWLDTQLRAVAAGMGVTYEQLTGDLTGVNYSSIRAGLLEFRRRIEMLQYNVLIRQFCEPSIRWFLDAAVASGKLILPGYMDDPRPYLDIEWHTPKWGWVDPLKDVMADILEIRSGLASRTQKIAERGTDIETVDRQAGEAKRSADSNGLVFDSDPSQTNKAGALQDAALALATQQEGK